MYTPEGTAVYAMYAVYVPPTPPQARVFPVPGWDFMVDEGAGLSNSSSVGPASTTSSTSETSLPPPIASQTDVNPIRHTVVGDIHTILWCPMSLSSKLASKDKRMVSPSFDLFGSSYILMAESAKNGFAKSRGRGIVSLKLQSYGPSEELTLEFSIQVGGTTYGPMCHNFAEKATPPESPQKAASILSQPILLVVRNVSRERNASLHFLNTKLKSTWASWVTAKSQIEIDVDSNADTEVSHEDNKEDPCDESDIADDVDGPTHLDHQAQRQQSTVQRSRWSEDTSDEDEDPSDSRSARNAELRARFNAPKPSKRVTRLQWADNHYKELEEVHEYDPSLPIDARRRPYSRGRSEAGQLRQKARSEARLRKKQQEHKL